MAKVIGKTKFKNISKIFFAWQEEKKEKWLREMSNEGWHLNEVGFLNYQFVKGEPKDIIYKLDYKPFRSEKIDDYITLFEDSGWEHAGRFAGWYYFRAEANKDYNLELYSDNASKIKKYVILRWIMIAVCAPIVYNLPNLILRLIRAFSSGITDDLLVQTLILNITLPITIILIIILGLLIFGIIRISLIIKETKMDIKE